MVGLVAGPDVQGRGEGVVAADAYVELGDTEKALIPILTDLLAKPAEPGLFYNVNLPILPPKADKPEVVA